MFSIEDLVLKYEKYNDDELFEIYSNIDTYSDEAKRALSIVLSEKGGLQNLIKKQHEKKVVADEVQRISNDVAKLSVPTGNTSSIKKIITSNVLSQEEINEIIDNTHLELELERDDQEIKPRTIIGSVIGGGIASIVGGILWGLQMIYTQRIFIIFITGLVLLCYGIIKVFTKQSNKNTVVLITIVISVILSLLIGQILYDTIGYKG